MGGRNWDRPSFKTQGRQTEAIDGGGVPREFWDAPKSLPVSKADLRRQADAAVRDFVGKAEPVAAAPPGGKPPWED